MFQNVGLNSTSGKLKKIDLNKWSLWYICSLRPGWIKIALARLTDTYTRVRTLACAQKLGGSGGMLPQENVNLMLWDGFWGYFGVPKHLCFSSGMVTGFWFSSMVCTHGDKCPSAVSNPLGTTWRSDARKSVRILLIIYSYCIPSIAGQECVATALIICSFSGVRSSLSHPDRDVRAWICTGSVCRFLACKQRVGNAISVKTLVRQSPGLWKFYIDICKSESLCKCTSKLQ